MEPGEGERAQPEDEEEEARIVLHSSIERVLREVKVAQPRNLGRVVFQA